MPESTPNPERLQVEAKIENINPEKNPIIGLVTIAKDIPDPLISHELADHSQTAAQVIVNQGPKFVSWALCQGRLAALKVVSEVIQKDPQLLTNDKIDGLLSSHNHLDRQTATSRLQESFNRARPIPEIDQKTAAITTTTLMLEGLSPNQTVIEQIVDTQASLNIAQNIIRGRLNQIISSRPITSALTEIRTSEQQQLEKTRHTLQIYSLLFAEMKHQARPTPTPESVKPQTPTIDDSLPPLIINQEFKRPSSDSWGQTLGEQLQIPKESEKSTFLPLKYDTGKQLNDLTIYGSGQFTVPASLLENTTLLLQLKDKRIDKILDSLYVRLERAEVLDTEKVAVAHILSPEEVTTINESKYHAQTIISEIEPELDNQANYS